MNSIGISRINDHVVKPLKIKTDPRPVKGSDIFPVLYGTLFLIAPTNVGKTTLIYNIIPKIIGKKTKVYIFASTAYNDELWLEIRKWLEDHDIETNVFTSTRDEAGNHIKELVSKLQEEAMEREEQEQDEKDEDKEPTLDEILEEMRKGIDTYIEKDDKPRKKREKFKSPDYLLIFDDLSDELRSPEISTLLKRSRHFHIKTIISSQYIKDLNKSARQQVQGWILMQNIPQNTLFDLHESIGLKLPWDVFYELYRKSTVATKHDPKPFLYFLPRLMEYRRNLNLRWKIPQEVYDNM